MHGNCTAGRGRVFASLLRPGAPSLGAAVGGVQVRAEGDGQETTQMGHGAVRGVGNRFVLLEILKNKLAS